MRLNSQLKRSLTFAIMLVALAHHFLIAEYESSDCESRSVALGHETDGGDEKSPPRNESDCELCSSFSKPAPEFELASQDAAKHVQREVSTEHEPIRIAHTTSSELDTASKQLLIPLKRSPPGGGPNAPPKFVV